MNKKKRNILIICSILILFLFLIVAMNITIKKVNGWTCSYTGSQKGNTTWLYFMNTGEWYEKSPIENHLERKGKAVSHNWVRTSGTSYRIISKLRAHAQAPPIYPLALCPKLQEQFIKTSTDEEIEAFLKDLNSGERKDQEETVRKLTEKIIKSCNKADLGNSASASSPNL